MIEPNPNPAPTSHTVKEIAAILRRSENSVRAPIKLGELPGRQIGKKFSILKRTFDAWYARYEEKPRRSDPFKPWT